MSYDVLFTDVDGNDLDDVAEPFELRFRALLDGHAWKHAKPQFVNHRHARDPSMRPEDLTDWSLGVVLPLPEQGSVEDALDDLVVLVGLLETLRRETGRDFVLGLASTETGVAEDCLYVDADTPTREQLRLMF